MITNYINGKSSKPNTLVNVVLELEQQNTGHIFFVISSVYFGTDTLQYLKNLIYLLQFTTDLQLTKRVKRKVTIYKTLLGNTKTFQANASYSPK